jgi:hypothetical protein
MLKYFTNIFRRDSTKESKYEYLKSIWLNLFISDSDKMNLNHLSPIARKVTQNHGTEPPFSSPLNSNKNSGLYTCVVCNTPVFRFN